MISKESALSIRLKKDLEKKSDIGTDETLKNIQMVNLWPQTNKVTSVHNANIS